MRPSLLSAAPGWVSTGPDGAAKVVVRTEMTAEDPPPIGVNEFGNDGGTEYAAGNLIHGACRVGGRNVRHDRHHSALR